MANATFFKFYITQNIIKAHSYWKLLRIYWVRNVLAKIVLILSPLPYTVLQQTKNWWILNYKYWTFETKIFQKCGRISIWGIFWSIKKHLFYSIIFRIHIKSPASARVTGFYPLFVSVWVKFCFHQVAFVLTAISKESPKSCFSKKKLYM